MPTLPGDAATAAARFVLLRDLPMLVVDLEPPADVDTPALLQDSLFRLLVERGLAVLPRFYGVDLPKGARVGLTLEAEVARVEDDEETTLLRVPRAGMERGWEERALGLKGTMLVVGHALGVGPDETAHEVCDLLDIAATAGRVAGAVVGVAEPRQGLPLIFG